MKEADATGGGRRRFRINAILGSVLIAIMAAWFYVHIRPYLDVALIGGVALIMSIWTIVRTFLKNDLDISASTLKQGVLTSRVATTYLLLLMGISLFLLATTSSIYVHWSGGAVTDGAIDAIDSRGTAFVRRLNVSPTKPVDGGPVLLRFASKPLHLRVAAPFGYDEIQRTLFPGQKLQLEFPHDFTLHRYRLVRVVPDLTWFQYLTDSQQAEKWAMTVHTPNGTYVIPGLRFQTVYIGASAAEIKHLLNTTDDEGFRAELSRYLQDQSVARTDASIYLNAWLESPLIIDTREFRPGERLEITISAPHNKTSKVTVEVKDKSAQTIVVPKEL